ncbi:MAG: hypothetical protein RIF32_12390 [Leptospirales bacterium]
MNILFKFTIFNKIIYHRLRPGLRACGISILAFGALGGCGGPLGGIQPVDTAQPGRPAYAVGILKGGFAHDSDFLRAAPYLLSERKVEMFAYVAAKAESGEPVCDSAWTSKPDLKIGEQAACAGKRNRRSYVPNRTIQADLSIVAGETQLPLSEGWAIQGIESYKVQPGDIVANQRLKSDAGFFYFNQYCVDAPQPECERLSFRTYRIEPGQEYVVVGALAADGKSIEAYVDEGGERHFYIAPLAHLAELQP